MQTVAWVGAGTACFGLFTFYRIQNQCVTHPFDLFNGGLFPIIFALGVIVSGLSDDVC